MPDSPPFGYAAIDSANQQIQDVSQGLDPTIPPGCYNLQQSQIAVGPGQTVTYPAPICFALSGPSDRITSISDQESSPTLTIEL